MKKLKTYRDVVQAVLDGHEVEYWDEELETWLPQDTIYSETRNLDKEILNYKYKYRIKPSKPSIDWEHVHPRYNYLARDENGVVFLYAKEPPKLTQQWSSEGNVVCKATSHISMTAGTCDWKDSLVKRPECV